MAFIPVPNTLQAEIRMIWQGERVENTLYFEKTGGWSFLDQVAFTADLREWWVTNCLPGQSNTLLLSSVYTRNLTTQAGSMSELSGNGALGSTGSPTLPNNVSIAVSFRTSLVGRSFRGRNYWAGLCEDQVTGNNVVSEHLGFILDAYDALFAVATAAGAEWVIVSRYANNVARETGVTTPVTNVVMVDPGVDSMRRRLPGRGT